jgi:BirA family biotin operon repressor/biotin-[acetyl-CoA-carboxylase] ligase
MTFGATIHRLESVPSTNDAARELARAGAAHGTAVVAEEQTRGRGTKGRIWHSPRGRGLYASFIVRWEGPEGRRPEFVLLPLAAGLAAGDAILESAGVSVRLKWPNDLVWDRKKLGGILTESVFRGKALDFAVLGVGVNVNQEEDDFPGNLKGAATSLRLVTGRPASRERLLGCLCRALDSWYNRLVQGERAGVIRAYDERMPFSRGTRVFVSTARGEISGIYRGLAEEGRLRVERDAGPVDVSFEEIQGLDWQGQGESR